MVAAAELIPCPVALPEGTLAIAVVGSRRWRNLARVRAYVKKIAEKYPGAVVVSGGAVGADTAAERAALRHGLRVVSFRPEPALPHDLGPKPWAAWLAPDEPPSPEVIAAWDAYNRRAMELAGVYLVAVYELSAGESRVRYLPDRFPGFGLAARYRNGLVVDLASVIVAFHQDNSSGTADTLRKADERGKEVHRYAA